MKTITTMAAGLLRVVSAGCATPITAQIRWEEPGRPVKVRTVEFETYGLTESEDQTTVFLQHEESFMPWDLTRHYLGDILMFSFEPVGPGDPPAPVIEANYELKAYVFFDSALVEGTVTPVPNDPESPGDFHLVFENSNFGEYISTITITGRLRR